MSGCSNIFNENILNFTDFCPLRTSQPLTKVTNSDALTFHILMFLIVTLSITTPTTLSIPMPVIFVSKKFAVTNENILETVVAFCAKFYGSTTALKATVIYLNVLTVLVPVKVVGTLNNNRVISRFNAAVVNFNTVTVVRTDTVNINSQVEFRYFNIPTAGKINRRVCCIINTDTADFNIITFLESYALRNSVNNVTYIVLVTYRTHINSSLACGRNIITSKSHKHRAVEIRMRAVLIKRKNYFSLRRIVIKAERTENYRTFLKINVNIAL